ncbi:hypothetical protein BT96DRAFT_805983 [Gymnopus androsaceus JB14]|uniref:Uncharacterized protein n=1 Tax=Gymnopus androsaceus JB14 TaxID=1447944 RepID=A0A6A4IHM2_9AGAR|nr:hypothetical protein BT96DRAFT_805983 [Gymnopus androsaceus JB14]
MEEKVITRPRPSRRRIVDDTSDSEVEDDDDSEGEDDNEATSSDEEQKHSTGKTKHSTKSYSKPKTLFPPPSPLDLELVGIIIETMTLTRSSSHLASALRGAAVNDEGGVAGMSEEDIMWVSEFERIMAESATRCGMFGKVESSFRNDPRDLPLPFSSRFFYVPECDPDTERAQLVRLTMPGSGKRSETMKYKQYYWKPVGK